MLTSAIPSCIIYSIIMTTISAQRQTFYFFSCDVLAGSSSVSTWTISGLLTYPPIPYTYCPSTVNGGCWDIRGLTTATKTISTVGYHSIKIYIDAGQLLLSGYFCRVQYKSASTGWVDGLILNYLSSPIYAHEITVTDTSNFNDQSSFQVRLWNNGHPDNHCSFDNIQLTGIPITKSPTPSPTAPCCECLVQTPSTPGCSVDTLCESNVCALDLYCCATAWDSHCTAASTNICNTGTLQPSFSPTITTQNPTKSPTSNPSTAPTNYPTSQSLNPTSTPTSNPVPGTSAPTNPTNLPTLTPSIIPTSHPTINPITPTTPSPTKSVCCGCSSNECSTDPICSPAVCQFDPLCCSNWDQQCIVEAQIVCKRNSPSPTAIPTPPTNTPTFNPTNPSTLPSKSPTNNPSSTPTGQRINARYPTNSPIEKSGRAYESTLNSAKEPEEPLDKLNFMNNLMFTILIIVMIFLLCCIGCILIYFCWCKGKRGQKWRHTKTLEMMSNGETVSPQSVISITDANNNDIVAKVGTQSEGKSVVAETVPMKQNINNINNTNLQLTESEYNDDEMYNNNNNNQTNGSTPNPDDENESMYRYNDDNNNNFTSNTNHGNASTFSPSTTNKEFIGDI